MMPQDLESRLRSLKLAEPPQELDDRIEHLLVHGSSQFPHNSTQFPANTAVNRLFTGIPGGRISLTAASLLLGVAMGFAMGSSKSDRGDTELASRGTLEVSRDFGPEEKRVSAELKALFLEAEKHQIGSTARERMAYWQEKTGETFDVRAHVADSRFEFCRVCHLANGS